MFRELRADKRLRFEQLEQRLVLDGGAMAAALDPVELDDFARFNSPEQIEQILVADALQKYEWMFGQPVYSYLPRCAVDMGRVAVFGGGLETTAQNGDHSDTNTQVDGVDEGDLVETDGDYVYALSNGELAIVDSRTAEEPLVASRVALDGQAYAMYLHGDRLTVLSGSRYNDWWFGAWEPVWGRSIAPWEPAPQTVTATVLDVSDRYAPTLVQETELDGSLVDSRAIGDSVYLVLSSSFELPPPEQLPVDTVETDEAWQLAITTNNEQRWYPPRTNYVYETQQQYLTRIEGQVLELGLPHFSGFGADGELVDTGLLSGVEDIYRPLSPDDDMLTSVVEIDMGSDDPGPVSSTSIPFHPEADIHVSTDSIYLINGEWSPDGISTSILKFDFDDVEGGVDLSAVGSVPGRVLNQFSIDEHDGYLRIATTRGWQDDSGVYILQQVDQGLETVGLLEGLGPDEQIYSVRFMADRAFVVTFRQFDPLFAIDLSQPTAPELAGELVIPGFSNYLHVIDNDFLIGIGRNADELTGMFADPQVSLFDVSDMNNPQMLDRVTIPTGLSGGLQAFDDHHAIAYYPEYQVLTVSAGEGGTFETRDDGTIVYHPPVNDLWVFRIDVTAGEDAIEMLGRIEHETSVLRSVRIEDLLYSLSQKTVTVHEILDLGTLVAELDLTASPPDPIILPTVQPEVDNGAPVGKPRVIDALFATGFGQGREIAHDRLNAMAYEFAARSYLDRDALSAGGSQGNDEAINLRSWLLMMLGT